MLLLGFVAHLADCGFGLPDRVAEVFSLPVRSRLPLLRLSSQVKVLAWQQDLSFCSWRNPLIAIFSGDLVNVPSERTHPL